MPRLINDSVHPYSDRCCCESCLNTWISAEAAALTVKVLDRERYIIAPGHRELDMPLERIED